MKITSSQLPYSLKNNLASFYLVSGDETLLVEEACNLIRSAAAKQDVTERECFVIEKGFAWQSLLASAKNYSLFSEKKLIELQFINAKLDATGSRALENYLANPPQDKILLIVMPKLSSGSQKTKWIKAIEEKGVLLQIWPIEVKQLPNWISGRCRQKGFSVNSEACKILSERVEGNLLACAQEIDKLSLLYGAGVQLTAQHIIAAVSHNARFNLFNLVDAALAGDAKKTAFMLNSLKAEGTEAILILWALARELRSLINLAQSIKAGLSLDETLRKQYVLAKRIPIIKVALERHSQANLTKLLQKAAHLDLIIKGARAGNAWQELLELALNLAGVNLINEEKI